MSNRKRLKYEGEIMEQNFYWPGAYSFKNEIRILLECMQEQIEVILKKIEKADSLAG